MSEATAAALGGEPTYNPFDPETSTRIANRQIRETSNRALRKGAKYSALLGGIGMLQTGGLLLFGWQGFELPFVFAGVGAVLSLGIGVLARFGLVDGWVKFIAFAVFVSFPTGFLFAAHATLPFGAATYLNGPMVYLYFHLILMTGFMFDYRLSLMCGLVAAAGFLAAFFASQAQIEQIQIADPVARQDLVDPAMYLIKAFMMVFAGVVTAALAVISRGLVLSTVKKAYERGSYRLVERIGHGGMGEVWTAEHTMLARSAAVKLIKVRAGDAGGESIGRELLERFEAEAQATARLRSPHTIEIYDFGLADDGTFFYVMELLDGMDLDTLVRDFGPQPAERVVFVLKQICHSLHEAHRAGLVHRDIKPANIFVCRYGAELDFIKVLDFGLVKDAKNVDEGAVVGTPAYLSPEAITGEAPIDGRSDLYALGCVGYWLLTGRLVFDGDSPDDIMKKHVREVPGPPSETTELEVPAALDEAIVACLAKDPAERPAGADALLTMLDDVPLASPWTPERRERWWQLHVSAGG